MRPSVERVTTCQGRNFPLFFSAVMAACSKPPQQGGFLVWLHQVAQQQAAVGVLGLLAGVGVALVEVVEFLQF